MISLDHLLAAARPWRATLPTAGFPEALASRVLARMRGVPDMLRPWWTGGLIAVAGASAMLLLTFLRIPAPSVLPPLTEPLEDQLIRSVLIP